MGRPPLGGAPVFRFSPKEVQEMEKILEDVKGGIPSRDSISALSEKFSESPERAGKILVQSKQVWNWFQNRRYAQKAKGNKVPGKLNVSHSPRDDSVTKRTVTNSVAVPSGRNVPDVSQMEFEAKSARDGAWYDVSSFVTHRMFDSGDPEVRVRFAGFGAEEDEWVNVRKCVRQRSLPCEASECIAVLPGDLILCFQEGKDQALYFDAHVLDAQRRRHDVRGCRCRFLVRYDHDQSEEIVPLRKVCRRPETDYRLQLAHASKELSSFDLDQGSQRVKDAPTLPTNFGDATQEDSHAKPEIQKTGDQVMEDNRSLTAPQMSSDSQVKEPTSSESQTNFQATEVDSKQEDVATGNSHINEPSDSIVNDAVTKSIVQG
ncbi:hypothetical protein SUGI_0197960 [Cryptomeria japonica]|uniref:protein SAWADEE HOMEODOMAIN HOMOLOG 2 isoform X2 n=1 Tax=Cryptomeria japonica TaxID=3369 RepID=UPI002408DD7D|nr:protein SAWADEE HOMEODOMAIN HOMOLOG 2 isoform X2 [Cryptomeria japonica]GLJ12795.1 hypothetical protein SUGI_0197960 [Cryptomeria japonica]